MSISDWDIVERYGVTPYYRDKDGKLLDRCANLATDGHTRTPDVLIAGNDTFVLRQDANDTGKTIHVTDAETRSAAQAAIALTEPPFTVEIGGGKFNINHSVKVKLTRVGLRIHKDQYDDLGRSFPALPKYTPPKVDADGYSKFQMWELMQRFGGALCAGCDLPFETEIVLCDN